MEAVKTQPTYPSFETVWTALQEIAERQKETDRQMKENARELKENAERLDKQLGKLGIRMGEVAEYMVVSNLREKFRQLGLKFSKTNQNTDVSDYDNQIFLEIDVFLENFNKAMLVETKTKPTIKDVQEHIKRLEKMRVFADLHGDKRAFLGAIAGAVVTANVKKYALEQGFYIIEPSGETFNITAPEGEYSPREW